MSEEIVIQKEETTAEAPVEEIKEESTEPTEKILGKFESQEDLEKAYKELESKIGKPPVVEEEVKEPGLEIQDKAEEVVEEAGLDMDSLQKEFIDNGELTNESLSKLEKVGISKDIVNTYIEGQQALAKQIESQVKNVAGGNDGYAEMITWAKDNLSEDEISTYNRIVNGRDLDSTMMAVQGLKARMGQTAEPNLIRGKSSVSSTDVYESYAQVTKDMNSPDYAKDPAVRERVKAKLARSNI